MYMIFMILVTTADTFEKVLVYHVMGCMFAGICESVAVMVIDDIFFLHERGAKLAYYTASLCLGSIAPVPAGYILDAPGHTFKNWYYVLVACSATLLIVGFFAFTETYFDREAYQSAAPVHTGAGIDYADKEDVGQNEIAMPSSIPKRSYVSQLKVWGNGNPNASFFVSLGRSFSYLAYPAVVWTIIAYGIFIGTGALFIAYTFPTYITGPPNNWPEAQSGLIAAAACVGVIFFLPVGWISDKISARLTLRNGGIREPEMRLWTLLPAVILCPGGLLIYGLTVQYNKHWIGAMIGDAIFQGAAYIGYVVTIAYTVDCYNKNVPEMLAIICACKQTISFGCGLKILNWIASDGIGTITGIFAALLFLICFAMFPFIYWGKSIRRVTGKWKIATVHKQ